MDKIIEALAQYFSPKFKEKLTRCESLEKLIKKLEKKQLHLEEQLLSEQDPVKKERLKTKLAVLKLQKEKALKLLNESAAN